VHGEHAHICNAVQSGLSLLMVLAQHPLTCLIEKTFSYRKHLETHKQRT
jgi:hypothetical protein